MPNTQQLKVELEDSESLKIVTESLSEVAALKFKSTRNEIQHNKIFFKDVSNVYYALRVLAERRRLTEHLNPSKNGRTISLLITSNYAFYGGLDSKLSHYFKDEILKYQTEKVVVGTMGKNYLSALDPGGGYEYFVMKSDMPNAAELRSLIKRIKDYSRILVYHSKFVTILDQGVEVTDLAASQALEEAQKSQIQYLLEPELGKMIDFFESQITSSILVSLFLQAELSRTAARMIGMDTAELNAEKLIDKQKLTLTRTKHKIQNMRVLEAFPSFLRLEEKR